MTGSRPRGGAARPSARAAGTAASPAAPRETPGGEGPGSGPGGRGARTRHARTIAGGGALTVLLGLSGQLSSLGLLAVSGWLLATASLRPPILTLTVAIAAVRLFALLRGAGRYGERLASHDLALRVVAAARVDAFRRLEPLVPGGLGEERDGDVLARLVGDVDATQDIVVRVLLPTATGLLTVALGVALAVVVLPAAGIVLAIGVLLASVVVPLVAQAVGAHRAATSGAARGRLSAELVGALHGAFDILAFGATGSILANLERSERELSRLLRRGVAVVAGAEGLRAVLAGLTTAAMVLVGMAGAAAGRLSPVLVVLLAFLSLATFASVQPLPEAFARLGPLRASRQRVRAVGRLEPTVRDPALPARVPSGPATLMLQGASIRYPGARECAIRGVDLAVAPGRRIALVGESGSGKTTLLLGLLRFLSIEEGSFSVNGIGAERLAGDDVRELLAWVSQEPHIFGASVAANLRLACPSATDEELEEELEALCLGPWLRGLPGGLRSELGERGTTVSGGERQRLGLARALLSRRPVLLADEASAHLDEATARLVEQHVLASVAERDGAVVWVTHRWAGLEAFDEVIRLEEGRVVGRTLQRPSPPGLGAPDGMHDLRRASMLGS